MNAKREAIQRGSSSGTVQFFGRELGAVAGNRVTLRVATRKRAIDPLLTLTRRYWSLDLNCVEGRPR